MTFRILPLPYAPFAPLFAMDEATLAQRRGRRVAAAPGSPCRVSLDDAAPGETLLLVNHVYQPADTPFHASHAIYVRENAAEWHGAVGTIPPALARRTISARAFDAQGLLVTAELSEGHALAPVIEGLLHEPVVAEVQLHYAAYGCFAARAVRA